MTHPYPGAFSDLPAGRLRLWRTRVLDDAACGEFTGSLRRHEGVIEIHPLGGGVLRVLDAELVGGALDTLPDVVTLPLAS